jgi:FKBP-type peptidyl-prolyl cis-trans isomerase
MFLKSNKLALAMFALVFASSASAEKVALETDKQKLGYTMGIQVMGQLLSSGLKDEIDVEALIAAQRDLLSGAKPQMTPEEMQLAQQTFMQKRQKEFEELAAKNQAAGAAFIEKSKKESGAKVTPSGLVYFAERAGKGKTPGREDKVKVHYAGSLIDGTTFDSSYERNLPAEFVLAGVIPGFAEGLAMMKEGAKYRFIIPAQLAYGTQAPPSIGPDQTLIFDVELLEVIQADKSDK